MKLGDLVLVQWEDSQGCPQGWVHVSDMAMDGACSEIDSVGWVIAQTNRTVQLAPHKATFRGEPNCMQGYMTIPLSCILKTRVLEKAKP